MKKFLFPVSLIIIIIFQFSCGRSKVEKQTDQNYVIGESKMGVNDYPGAIAAFTKCINLNPNNYDAYHQRALAYKAMGNKKLALSNYKRAQAIMEKKEDLKDAGKHAEYQALLQEIKDYSAAPDMPAATTPAANQPVQNNVPDTARD